MDVRALWRRWFEPASGAIPPSSAMETLWGRAITGLGEAMLADRLGYDCLPMPGRHAW